MKLSGICLITDDVLTLVKYYCMVLNASYSGDETHAEVEVPGLSLAIYSREAAVRDMKFSFPSAVGCGNTVLMFAVNDVDTEYGRLRACGLDFVTAPTTYPWGARSFHFRDPDGNLVDFFCRPA